MAANGCLNQGTWPGSSASRQLSGSANSENEIGCFFDRNADGTLHHKAFAGQTADRTVHKGDLTGIEIINRLMEQVLSRPVEKAAGTPRHRPCPDERRDGAVWGAE